MRAGTIPKFIRNLGRFLLNKVPVKIEVRLPRPKWLGEDGNFSYQALYINFDIKPTDQVLDIGSGPYPFPYATVLADKFPGSTEHRHGPLVREGKPLVLADIHNLPFHDKVFDFVYCSHLLEHVENPLKACAEIMRVGKRGFIETPTMFKDALFTWAKGMHKWHVVAIGQNLCFFEYSQRQLEGIGSSVWRDIIFSTWYHPLQRAFYENQDLFSVMFTWFDSFAVFAFHLDGTVEASAAEVRYQNVVPHYQH